MIGYNDLYETLRKEKYSDQHQPLSKKFIAEYAEYIKEKREISTSSQDLFSDAVIKSKKQLENSIAMFKELMLKRKRKILNLVIVATETGIMKRDYENMLGHEKESFDKIVQAFETSDKNLSKILNATEEESIENRMIIFTEDIDQFVDHKGTMLGPFKSGELANLKKEIADIFVSGNKATLVDET